MTLLFILTVAAAETVATPWYLSNGFFALVGTLGGGVLLKAAESWFNRPSRKAENRRDLNAENKDLVERVDTLEAEVTEWRTKFYAQQEQIAVLRQALIKNGIDIPDKA